MICPKCDGVGTVYSGYWGSFEDPWQADQCDVCGGSGQIEDIDLIEWLVADADLEVVA